MADQFFWIAFAPHGGTKWDKITSSDEVKSAVLHKDLLDINFVPNQVPEESFSAETAELVSDRLWMLILSEKQIDHLTLSKEHHGVIEKFIVDNAKEVEL
ncbi:hypothetical protein D2E36_16645 [Mycobacteroides abscessus]|nr:hypothetical protein D2E38_16035 [Mycobacteroides abscessus]RIR38970.1 hypothetical protein D2E36_16645 [Mycobacteroides abscessus]RIT55819.1 hypothetical protein D2E95_17710 [Mycobacteroides abscessus]RIU53548.1 hypothetical protein D2F02_03175 [Mycobacteroides abscessus]